MRPKNYTEDITKLINNLTQQITYSPTPEEDIEHLDEYVEFISELLTEFRNDRVYVIDSPVVRIPHPEGLEPHLDPNIRTIGLLVDKKVISVGSQMMYSFERLKLDIIQELELNREVFIYSIAPSTSILVPTGERQHRPYIRWSKIPLEIWYNTPPPIKTKLEIPKTILKHKL